MIFIEMISRESKNEDDIQVAGVVITKGGQTELKGGLNLLCSEFEYRKSRTIKGGHNA